MAGGEICQRPLTDGVPCQSPEILDVVGRHDISKEVADRLAFGDVAIELSAAREDFGKRALAQQIPADLPQRFAGVKHVAIRIDAGEHGGKTLEVAELEHSANQLRSA